MRRMLPLLLVLAVAACADTQQPLNPGAPPQGPALSVQPAPERIPNEWIVQLHDDAADVPGLARALAARHGGTVEYVWEHALKGFSLHIPDAAIQGLARNPHVKRIAPNMILSVSAVQSSAPWHLDRVDQRNLPVNGNYYYGYTGSGVRVYVIDTGVRTTHNEFGGRASHGWDFVNNDSDASDCEGHGTKVAGIVAGSTYGVAKSASIVAVRVLDCSGNGRYAHLISGVNWVTSHHTSAGGPSVANMSVGGPASSFPDSTAILETAVQGAINAGVAVVAASGNSNTSACNFTPARVSGVITVGATDASDDEPLFSNYGSCVDLLAPGVTITSAYYTSDSAVDTDTGTSFAAPAVAGAAALYKQYNPTATPAQVSTALVNGASTGKIDLHLLHPGTPNKLLYTPFVGFAVTLSGPSAQGHNNTCSWSVSVSGGVPPYTYSWWGSYSSGSTGWYVTSGQGTANITGWGYYYPTYPQYTTVMLTASVTDASGQNLSPQRAISLYNSPGIGCMG